MPSLVLTTGILGGLAVPALAAGEASLPSVALRHFDPEFLDRTRRYHDFRYVLFAIEVLVFLGLLWWVALRPPRRLGEAALRLARGRFWGARWAVLSGWVLALALLRLPFSLIRFHHAASHGLRHDTLGSFLGDWAKGTLLGWLLASVVGLLVLWLFARFRRSWWGWAGAGIAVLAPAYALVAPLAVDPLFNRITPLEASPLTERILAMSGEAGLPAREVWVADASRRTRAVNAYFTGVGPSRRIVLYDTLVEKLPEREVLLVVAHEIGHWTRHHLAKGLTLGVLGAVGGLLAAHVVLGRWVDRRASREAGRRDPLLVFPAYALYYTLMLAALPVSNAVSRGMEGEADRVAIATTGDPAGFVAAKVRGARENLSDVLPPEWIERLLFTHPSVARRIAAAESEP